MSYLIGPRLHFAGTFTADVSTENNYTTHFKDPLNPNDPGWNPSGTGSWEIKDCTVKSAVFKDGTVARSSADDPVVGRTLVRSDAPDWSILIPNSRWHRKSGDCGFVWRLPRARRP